MSRTKNPARVLIVSTSAAQYEVAGYRTGLWLGELTHFYDVLAEAGHELTIASVAGGLVPIDPESLAGPVLKMGGTDKRYEDPAFMALLAETRSVESLADEPWDAVYLAGGHGTMFDFPHNAALAGLLARTLEQGGIVSAVCHGPAAFVGARRSDGKPLIEGRTVTGFSWAEEKLAGRDQVVPFRLHEALKDEGASYTKALLPLTEKVVSDGRLVTGQNPTSAAGVGKAVVRLLKRRES